MDFSPAVPNDIEVEISHVEQCEISINTVSSVVTTDAQKSVGCKNPQKQIIVFFN